jgi:hypothetical protein
MPEPNPINVVPVRYIGSKPWEMDNCCGTFRTFHADSTLGPYTEPFPEHLVPKLLDRYPGLFEVVGNLAYVTLSRDELNALYKERYGRGPLTRYTDAEVIFKLQQWDADHETSEPGGEPPDCSPQGGTGIDSGAALAVESGGSQEADSGHPQPMVFAPAGSDADSVDLSADEAA